MGRDRELARLAKSWARAQAGTLTTPGVVFRGEPGIGKSRLAVVAAELVEASGAVVLELAGSPFHTDAGLHPVRTLLGAPLRHRPHWSGRTAATAASRIRSCLAGTDGVTRSSVDPVSVVPLLAPVLGIGAEAGYEPVPAQGRKLYELIAQAVRDYLMVCLGGERPGLVVAEDVHWFDASTLEVLGALLTHGEGRVLVVITGRPGGGCPRLAGQGVQLKALTEEQTDRADHRPRAARFPAAAERCSSPGGGLTA